LKQREQLDEKRGEEESLRGCVFDCLPGDEEADDIVAVALDAGEMGVGIVQRERPANKADRVGVFEEAVGDVAGDVGRGGLLGVAADIQAAQGQHSAGRQPAGQRSERGVGLCACALSP
jgi:hypothetical protein